MLALADLRVVFTFESSSSIGLRSGKYGGGKSVSAPTSEMERYTSAMWCIEQLSKITTKCGLILL